MKNRLSVELVVIVGPTGVGKTEVAVKVAGLIGGEIISADSMQIYRKMDIGTAKPGRRLQKQVRHHLIDIKDPGEEFDVNAYQKLAREAIADIKKRGKIPILVGGTGLYIRSVLFPLKFAPKDISGKIRQKYEDKAAEHGVVRLWSELNEKDPASAGKIEKTDLRRIVRALEVIELTGEPFSASYENWKQIEPLYRALSFGLIAPRQVIYDKINQRVDAMIEMGLIDEVKRLLSEGFYDALTAGQAIGYKEIVRYIDGAISLEEAADKIKTASRNYAKRQITWFRSDPQIQWIDVSNRTTDEVAGDIAVKVKEEDDQS